MIVGENVYRKRKKKRERELTSDVDMKDMVGKERELVKLEWADWGTLIDTNFKILALSLIRGLGFPRGLVFL